MNGPVWPAVVSAIAAAVAVVVGGLWSYYRIVRGRTFGTRADLEVSGKVHVTGDGLPYGLIEVVVRNLGSDPFEIRSDLLNSWITVRHADALTLMSLPRGGGSVDVGSLADAKLKVFQQQIGPVQPNESVRDVVLAQLPFDTAFFHAAAEIRVLRPRRVRDHETRVLTATGMVFL